VPTFAGINLKYAVPTANAFKEHSN
jgi:hypothetical protein